MDVNLIRAHLNLYAVLQNLEDLVALDPEMADFTRNWDLSIQFVVMNGPSAYLEFKNGVCKHGVGKHPNPTVRLFFLSPAHANKMFAGKGAPIPLKGFSKLGFLQKDFARLTARLEYFLKPAKDQVQDDFYCKINTTLTLYTVAYAVCELAQLEPTCKMLAASTPNGILGIRVLPDGPAVHLTLKNGLITAGKGLNDQSTSRMTFKDITAANELLSGRLDAFMAVAEQRLMLQGVLPIIDNISLVMDRVEQYLA
jgi:hypothetical protein